MSEESILSTRAGQEQETSELERAARFGEEAHPTKDGSQEESDVPRKADTNEDAEEPTELEASQQTDVLHYDFQSDEPDQLAYLEALAARLSDEGDGLEDVLPLLRDDIEPVRALCTRPFDGHCDRCVRACPHNAISLGEDDLPRIDDDHCTNCGICAGICDGFSSVRITLEDLMGRAAGIAKEGLAVTFACNDMVPLGAQAAENALVIPCLAYLPPEALSLLLAQGVQVNVCCDFDLCASCQVTNGKAAQLFEHCFAMAETQTDKQIGFVDSVPTNLSLTESLSQEAKTESDRRNMLSSITASVTDVTSGHYRAQRSSSTKDYQENRERMRARGHIKQHEGMTLEEFTSDHRLPKYWPRRKLALDAAQADPTTGSALALWISTTNDETCRQAHTCVDACPTGARQVDESGHLAFDASYCIACGACVSTCREQACSFVETCALDLLQKRQAIS